jgi:hypothetical protein
VRGIRPVFRVNAELAYGLAQGGAPVREVQGGGGGAGDAGARDATPRGSALAFIGAGHGRGQANRWRRQPCPAWPMGLGGPGGRAGAGWVGPRARPNPVGQVFLFFELIFNAKTNSRKV